MSLGEADSVVPEPAGVRATNEEAPEAARDGAANDEALVKDIAGTKSESSGDVAPSARKAIGSGGGSVSASDADINEVGDGEDSKDISTGELTDGLGRDVGVECSSVEGPSPAAVFRRKTRSVPAKCVAGRRASADADTVRSTDATVPMGPSARRSWPRGREVAASCDTGICAASERCTAMFAVTGIALCASNSGGGNSRQPCGSRGWLTAAVDSASGTRWIIDVGFPAGAVDARGP